MSGEVSIHPEGPDDAGAVDEICELAFGRRAEADLVRALRKTEPGRLSLVAKLGARIVGHILFTEVTVDGSSSAIGGMGLAPMAVHPDRQRKGIGGHLVRGGLTACADRSAPFAVVLGHASYYPRFGFKRAADLGLRYSAPGSEDSFFAIELRSGGLAGVAGVVHFAGAFDAL